MIKFCSLFSSSSGNCTFVSTGRTNILIDAGVSGRRIEQALKAIDEDISNVDAMLVTHEHSDHIKGLGVLSRRHNIPIYANEATWGKLGSSIGQIREANIKRFETKKVFEINDCTILPFPTPHDAVLSSGFNIFVSEMKLTIATDIGHISKELLGYLRGSTMLMLESNHDVDMLKAGSYPYHIKRRIMGDLGHLSNEMAGKVIAYLAEEGTKLFILGHLSQENNFPKLAYQTVLAELACKGINVNTETDITLTTAGVQSSYSHSCLEKMLVIA